MKLPKNIVIVEDEVITQRYLKDILGQYDVNISGCFDNAADVTQGLKECECDMLLMDINIKGPIDGIQLARTLLEKYSFPIIFITAHNDDTTFQEVLEIAPYGFIEKPFSSKDVAFTLQLAYQRFLTVQESDSASASTDKSENELVTISSTYKYSRAQSVLYKDDQAVKLNIKQSKLIEILVQNINSAVSYDVFEQAIWEDAMIADSALRTLVYSIRKEMPDFPITSYSKIGYSLTTETES